MTVRGLNNQHPVDVASLALCHAKSVIGVLEAIFEEPDKIQYINDDDLLGSIILVRNLIVEAKAEVDSLGLCQLPPDHPVRISKEAIQ